MHPVTQISSQAHEIAAIMQAFVARCQDREVQGYRRFGLTVGEGRFLQALSQQNFSSPSAAAEILSVARSRITQIVDGLVRKGFITRCESEKDRRFQNLCLTERGTGTLEQIISYLEDVHVRLLIGFDPAKRQSLLQDLRLLKEKMDSVRH